MKPDLLKTLGLALAFALGSFFLASSVLAQADDTRPEAATDTLSAAQTGAADRQMVVAAHPLAAEAGLEVLRAGGTAADAAVAVQLMLGLVEPQSSGLGGGAFLVYWDAEHRRLTTLDGRETAPLAATNQYFLDPSGTPRPWPEMVPGGLSVGVPGTPALLQAMHDRWGVLPRGQVAAAAVQTAREGFAVTPRLNGVIEEFLQARGLGAFAQTRDLLLTDSGDALPVGHLHRNPALADAMERFAAEGAAPFYTGDIAARIVDTVRRAPENPGLLTRRDLARYRVVERAPICVAYRQWDVCGMGPPSSGATTVGQILGLSRGFDLPGLGATADGWSIIAQASALAFADRNRYLGDPDVIPVPTEGLMDPAYLAARATLIQADGILALPAEAGLPPGAEGLPWASDTAPEVPGTSHISIVDAAGNIVSMTTTIESGFGSRLVVDGFLLNNELTDFGFSPVEDGRAVANSIRPGARPRSSMAPTIVFDRDSGDPVLVVGSPGGSRIIGYVVQAIIGILDWGMTPAQAVAAGHVLNRNGRTEVEAETEAATLTELLETQGFEIQPGTHTSGLGLIVIRDGRLHGAADPRREGRALGD